MGVGVSLSLPREGVHGSLISVPFAREHVSICEKNYSGGFNLQDNERLLVLFHKTFLLRAMVDLGGALAWFHMWSDEAVGSTHSSDLLVSALSDLDPSRSKDKGRPKSSIIDRGVTDLVQVQFLQVRSNGSNMLDRIKTRQYPGFTSSPKSTTEVAPRTVNGSRDASSLGAGHDLPNSGQQVPGFIGSRESAQARYGILPRSWVSYFRKIDLLGSESRGSDLVEGEGGRSLVTMVTMSSEAGGPTDVAVPFIAIVGYRRCLRKTDLLVFRPTGLLAGQFLSTDIHPNQSKAGSRRALYCLGHGFLMLIVPTLRLLWSDLVTNDLDASSDPVRPYECPVCHGKCQNSGVQFGWVTACVHRKSRFAPKMDLGAAKDPVLCNLGWSTDTFTAFDRNTSVLVLNMVQFLCRLCKLGFAQILQFLLSQIQVKENGSVFCVGAGVVMPTVFWPSGRGGMVMYMVGIWTCWLDGHSGRFLVWLARKAVCRR